ncbi:ArsR family transcriptional regulator [Pseudooceanicola sp. CBS1P-1]|uniref:ArsR family transcriptional regulator n=1 Tax=Pseudooceanicola albus TaxID=2692189 RepID=A0A6L7FWX9_9RHOB|nr:MULTISPECIES: helix-turn-helix transcriptional regulator [Pseudooceanicola]MBT9383413.1 ArsR family transcriptional regulator [Pseudooceanicola endophyticus]MXN16265.1 ArsR family transcriptional regulator [Pseudooceanicola albus]
MTAPPNGSSHDLAHPQEQDLDLTQVLFALSDPGRLEIVRQLRDGPVEMAQCNLADPTVAKSTKSHLFKVLREAGVILNLPKGRGRLLSLRREELDRRFPGLLDAVLDAS